MLETGKLPVLGFSYVEAIDSWWPKQAVAHGALDIWIPSLESYIAVAKKTSSAADEGRSNVLANGECQLLCLSHIWKWNMADIWRGTTIGKGIRLNSAQEYWKRCLRCWTKSNVFFTRFVDLCLRLILSTGPMLLWHENLPCLKSDIQWDLIRRQRSWGQVGWMQGCSTLGLKYVNQDSMKAHLGIDLESNMGGVQK